MNATAHDDVDESAQALLDVLAALDELEAASDTDLPALVDAYACVSSSASVSEAHEERERDDDDDDAAMHVRDAASDSSISASASDIKTPKRRVKKRRYHEVLRLRETVEELEREVRTLIRADDISSSSSSTTRTWRHAAKRAMQAATRAQLDNAKLRAAADVHKAFAVSLQETLTKQRNRVADRQVADCLSSVTHANVKEFAGTVLSAKERRIYDKLTAGVTARSRTTESRALPHALTRSLDALALPPHRTVTTTVQQDDRQCMCVDVVVRYILPFGVDAVAHVVWSHVLSKTLQFAARSAAATLTEILTHTDDTLVVKQSANLDYLTDHEQFTTEYAVSKRIAKTDAVDFLWESLTESRSGGNSSGGCDATLALPGIQLAQEGWGTVTRVSTAPRGPTAAACIVSSCARLTPLPTSSDTSELQSLQWQDGASLVDANAVLRRLVQQFEQRAMDVQAYIERTLVSPTSAR